MSCAHTLTSPVLWCIEKSNPDVQILGFTAGGAFRPAMAMGGMAGMAGMSGMAGLGMNLAGQGQGSWISSSSQMCGDCPCDFTPGHRLTQLYRKNVDK